MRVQIVLCFILEASFALQYEGDGPEFDILSEPREPAGEAPVRKDLSVNMNIHPDDTEVIKGAIKKLLGRDRIEHIMQHAALTPTHSPPPVEATQRPTKTFLSSITEPYRIVPEAPDIDAPDMDQPDVRLDDGRGTDKPETSETQATTIDSSDAVHKLDWFDRKDLEYPAVMISSEGLAPPISAGEAWNTSGTTAMRAGQMGDLAYTAWENANTSSFPTSMSYGPDAPDAANASDVYFRVGDNRTRHTRRTTGSTLNTLCTESADVCRTMCFDRQKYRVSCPTTTPRPTTPYLDMTKLLHMLSSLVADIDTNLTDVMNITLHKKGYKHCKPTTTETTTTTTMPPPTPPMYDYEPSENTGKVISKCYVCGMEELGIPREAHCADPFAKDLLPPAMPDHIAETKRKGYRKYCNYMDMKPWYINGSGIWGKWTGGCVVRWVDLSGVYTQRVCRIRDHPAIGRHFVSKRLAKLEFALRKVDNGCMLSPMATLVPFSRGVSLYARLHVCVCSANWCNPAHWPASLQGLWAAMVLLAAVLK